MSSAVASPLDKAVGFYQAPIGKKAVMAVTGVILFGYVVAHLLGNLQIYSADRQQINQYAAFLHDPSHAGFLWGARTFLLAAVLLHMVAATQLWIQNRSARPVRYVKKDDVPTAYAARTMIWSGPIIAAFVVFHVLHLTAGTVLPLQELGPNRPDVRANVIAGFQHPAVAGFYVLAMLLLCLHLYHGVWSMFQSVGVSHPRYTIWLKRFAALSALLIALGNISIPVAVLAGLLTN
ncbi:MAG: succinate dehydrogenase cytochrome b subunit [Acidobacteriia bacterium]|nr:succinate dehydrogenase cytochrome b subunit [Terriglobia bacterium]